jgi:hypothetical protein
MHGEGYNHSMELQAQLKLRGEVSVVLLESLTSDTDFMKGYIVVHTGRFKARNAGRCHANDEREEWDRVIAPSCDFHTENQPATQHRCR